MNKANQLLTEIYQSDEIKEVISKLRPAHLQEDILQHTFLELFQKPPEFIVELSGRGKLKAYIVKILYNTATYSRTTFAKQQGKETPTDFCHDSTYEVIRVSDDEKMAEQTNMEIACAVSEIHWYKARLLEMYTERGTYKAVHEATGIPVSSIFKTITQARKEIKRKLW